MEIKKNRVFYMYLVHSIQCMINFRSFMDAIVTCINVRISKMLKRLRRFQSYFTLYLKKSISFLYALENELQCYYHLHILYNLVVYNLHV